MSWSQVSNEIDLLYGSFVQLRQVGLLRGNGNLKPFFFYRNLHR